MTLVFQDPAPVGPATHAFVIGVGAYAFAKPGQGALPELRGVPDIPSASDGAKMIVDWLLANRGQLQSPLASLELLLSDSPPRPTRAGYPWASQADWTHPAGVPIELANRANVELRGKEWLGRIRPGDTAFFYICGHGARLGQEAVVFLDDLNLDPARPWAHINVVQLGLALKQLANVNVAYLFVDSCQELLPKFEIGDNRTAAAMFFTPNSPFRAGTEKVSLLSAASSGKLAYDGALPVLDPDSDFDGGLPSAQNVFDGGLPQLQGVHAGRFTQSLLIALNGLSARFDTQDEWTVGASDVFMDLKSVYQLRTDWAAKPFDPSQLLTMNVTLPIVRPDKPRFPIVISVDPATVSDRCALTLYGDQQRQTPLHARALGDGRPWLIQVEPSLTKHAAVAQLHDSSEPPAVVAEFERLFTPVRPILDARIKVQT